MQLSSFGADTPRVLKQCLDLISSPKHSTYSSPVEANNSDKYASHPDIQYFKKIKSKNHFGYHKYKKSPKKTITSALVSTSHFEPYSREQLLDRLSTYSSLNWSIPSGVKDLNELKCAQNGWECVSITIHNNSKNHLVCSSCKMFISLIFNDLDNDYGINYEDYEDLNNHIAKEYLTQIAVDGHEDHCPWRNFETPLKLTYYLPPFITSTNEILVKRYLSCLKSLVDNITVLKDKIELFPTVMDMDQEIMKKSNSWLLNKYYYNDKENKTMILHNIPPWIYSVAMLGWDLKVQSFSNHLVLFLVCLDCNKKVFLDSMSHPPISNEFGILPSTGLDIASSNILTPVKYPPSIEPTKMENTASQYDQVEEVDNNIDILEEHKSWCSHHVLFNDNDKLSDYLYHLIHQLEDINTDNMDIDDTPRKRKVSFDIKEGLERLNKLRKLYLVDDI